MSLNVSQEYARLKTAERFKQFLLDSSNESFQVNSGNEIFSVDSSCETFSVDSVMEVFQRFLVAESQLLDVRGMSIDDIVDSKLDYISWIRRRVAQDPNSPTNPVRERVLRDFAGSDNYLR